MLENVKKLETVPLPARTVILRIIHTTDWGGPEIGEVIAEGPSVHCAVNMANAGFYLNIIIEMLHISGSGIEPTADIEKISHLAIQVEVCALVPKADKISALMMDDQIVTLESRAGEYDDTTSGILVSGTGEFGIEEDELGKFYVISRTWDLIVRDISARASMIGCVTALDAGTMQGVINRALKNPSTGVYH